MTTNPIADLERHYREQPWIKRCVLWPLARVPRKLRYALRNYPRRFVERGRKGYSVEDCYNLEGYLARIIAPGCRELIREGHGWPGGRFGISEDEATGVRQWTEMLEKIATAFDVYAETDGWMDEPQRAQFAEALRLFCEVYPALWD